MARKSRKHEEISIKNTLQVIWYCASYCRLSDDDRTGKVSNSIENQKTLNREFIDGKMDLMFVDEFWDDGKSGTTFSRKGFDCMMKEIMAGHINCIVVKDLSRLGRNYIDTEDYITKVFPFLNVRFIAVNDRFDSNDSDCNDKMLNMRIKNLTNDLYAKQVSQSVGQAFKALAKKGVYHGPVPPYGYLIDNEIPAERHLVIDTKSADIPRRIFSRYIGGESIYSITKYLNENQIPPPMRYFSELGLYRSKKHASETKWYKSTVKSILENPAYCGCLAVRRHKRSLYQNIAEQKIPKEEWEFVYNTHQAIICRDDYEKTQKMLAEKTAQHEEMSEAAAAAALRKENIYSGKMRCGFCGKPLLRGYFLGRKEGRSYYQYCEAYKYKNTLTDCKKCYVNENKLEQIILALISKYCSLFMEKSQMLDQILNQSDFKQKLNKMEQEISDLEKEKQGILIKKKGLYLDFKGGILDEEEYIFAKGQFEGELLKAKEDKTKIEQYLSTLNERLNNTEYWKRRLMELLRIESITKAQMNELITQIVIYSPSQIKIVFSFDDAFHTLCEMISQSGKE